MFGSVACGRLWLWIIITIANLTTKTVYTLHTATTLDKLYGKEMLYFVNTKAVEPLLLPITHIGIFEDYAPNETRSRVVQNFSHIYIYTYIVLCVMILCKKGSLFIMLDYMQNRSSVFDNIFVNILCSYVMSHVYEKYYVFIYNIINYEKASMLVILCFYYIYIYIYIYIYE